MRTLSAILLVALCLLASSKLSAQNQDLEAWSSLGLSKEVSNDLQLKLRTGLRFNENISAHKLSLFQIGVTYKPIKWMRLTVANRQIFGNKYSSNRQRWISSLVLRRKWHKRLQTRYRMQYQLEKDTGSDWSIGENALRHRLTTSWRKRKTDITWTLGTEWFYTWEGSGASWSKYRLMVDAEYAINKRQGISAGYMFQSTLGGASKRTHVFSLGYSLSLK